MRSDRVVVDLPSGQSDPCMSKRAEEGLVQQLVAQPAVKTFDEGILLRLAGSDVVPVDAGFLTPPQDRHAGQFSAVIRDARDRPAAARDDGIELAPDAKPGQGCIGYQRQALPAEIVDDREDAEAPAIAQLVVQKIERPALVGGLWHGKRHPCAERAFPATTTANLQPLLGVEPAQLLVVQGHPFTPQQHVQSAIAEAPSNRSYLAQPAANEAIIRPAAAVPHRAAVHPKCLTCPPLAHPVDLFEVSGSFSSGGGRHHFLAATSRSMALSSIASARSLLSLAFSSVSAFSRRASDTSIPPYFAFHL